MKMDKIYLKLKCLILFVYMVLVLPCAVLAQAPQIIHIDVEGQLDERTVASLTERLNGLFYPKIEWSQNFDMLTPTKDDQFKIYADGQYDNDELLTWYLSQHAAVSPPVYRVLLVQGNVLAGKNMFLFSASQYHPDGRSAAVISLDMLRLPPFVTDEFARQRMEDRLLKVMINDLKFMYGYKQIIPECAPYYFKSIQELDLLPADVCPADRPVLEEYNIIRQKEKSPI